MTSSTKDLIPHREHRSLGIRKIYIQKLTDLLHICLLRNETERARRAWGILVRPRFDLESSTGCSCHFQIRCREVDWKSRWYWGLELLSAVSRGDETQTTVLPSTSRSQPDDVERWLKGLRIKAREEDVRLLPWRTNDRADEHVLRDLRYCMRLCCIRSSRKTFAQRSKDFSKRFLK